MESLLLSCFKVAYGLLASKEGEALRVDGVVTVLSELLVSTFILFSYDSIISLVTSLIFLI